MPVYILISHAQDDYTQMEIARVRLDRSLEAINSIRSRFPATKPSLMIEFSGASSEQYHLFNRADGRLDRLKDLARSGTVEFAYNGAFEPAPRTRPQPNFRTASSGRDLWLARAEAFDWFLNDYKEINYHSGTPDAARPGGLKRFVELLGGVVYAGGISETLGGDPELDHLLRKMKLKPVLPGVPEPQTWPARNIDGYGGGVPQFAKEMSADNRSLPEIYIQDHFLRLSDFTGAPVRRYSAGEGREVLEKALSALDRSRRHIIRVELSGYSFHIKPLYEGGPTIHPLEHVFEFPRRPVLPDMYRRSADEAEAFYRKQQELLDWLSSVFFPANPGSRFVSLTDIQMAASSLEGTRISKDQLSVAVKSFKDEWDTLGTYAPRHQQVQGGYLSLADMFSLVSRSLAGLHKDGRIPDSVTLTPIYGPLEVSKEDPIGQGEATVAEIARECARLVEGFDQREWTPIPAAAVPGSLTVAGLRLNSAQFLNLMLSAYLDPRPEKKVAVKLVYPVGASAFIFPSTRRIVEQGATWTVKPVVVQDLR